MELSVDEAILRLFFALLLGSIIGMEREFTQQPAGLRTHILVCLGSAVFTILSISNLTAGMDLGSVAAGADIRITRDPARIAAQIVTGIGFIGGGAVLRHGASVRGLTTAASLWMMASIGMLAGTGHYRLSLVATLITFLVLFTIGNVERSVFRKHLKTFNRLKLVVTLKPEQISDIQSWIEKNFGKEVLELKSNIHEDSGAITLSYIINIKGFKINVNDLSQKMNGLPGVISTNLKIYLEEGNSG